MEDKLRLGIIISSQILIILWLSPVSLSNTPDNFASAHSWDNHTAISTIEDILEPVVNFWNISLYRGDRIRRTINFEDEDTVEPKKTNYRIYHRDRYNDPDNYFYDGYNPRPHGRRGGRGYAFASAGGGSRGWNGGGGDYNYKGKGWNPAGTGGGGNNHYNPSVNKYGGGGPLSFIPGKGVSTGGGGGGGVSSSSAASASSSGGGRVPPRAPPETAVRIVTCEISDTCHNFVHCASHTYTYLRARDRCCLLRQQPSHKGMCCSGHSKSAPGNPSGKPFSAYPADKVGVPDIPESSLATAAEKGYEYKEKYNKIEDRLLELNIIVERGTAAYGHLQFFQVFDTAALSCIIAYDLRFSYGFTLIFMVM